MRKKITLYDIHSTYCKVLNSSHDQLEKQRFFHKKKADRMALLYKGRVVLVNKRITETMNTPPLNAMHFEGVSDVSS
ncbi:hypothetical protein IMZ31_21685 (plasmid) [Pontibacillus sp. ALD_SL1]|uniref:hypothetical protein n=1 Tax=Pontibacillus sp. ALD_SL1 TaxID=2777185 RepID=UPI001A969768|nr:hypothetical protein [Pontibacillus sp. ALD_SL1]QST02065.1 hypothetical protein IMZ31_21685 [Pontibacillus sp. ALD_SL1]